MTDSNSLKSFYKILSEDNYIQIPKIQRDYAQGRTGKECTEKREKFFSYLHKNIKGQGAVLDFLYGAEKEEDGKKIIELLDGQQRTTTLFLLHVYALRRAQEKLSYDEYKLAQEELKKAQENLKRFCYETRESSRRFCEAIIFEDYTIPKETKKDWIEQENKEDLPPLTREIKNKNWYYSAYDDDQTVKAMLVSLEDIHDLFSDFEGDTLWKALMEDEKIKFHYVSIENLGLTDDVYVKMNVRGKELSDFENIKADIEEKIQDDGKGISQERYLEDEKDFINNIDTTWTQFLWDYYKEFSNEEKPYPVGDAFMRLISACIIYNSDNKDVISNLNDNKQKYNMSDFFFFKDGNIRATRKEEPDNEDIAYSQKIFKMFCEFLDIYSSGESILNITPKITFWQDNAEYANFVKSLLLGDVTHFQRSMFLAHTLYLKKMKYENLSFDEGKYNDWMRVVRNMVHRLENSGFPSGRAAVQEILRDAKDMPDLLSLIKQLSKGCDDIYSYLSGPDIKEEAEGVKQYAQEVKKAKLIKKYVDKKELIHALEDNYVLHGNIEFAVLCADVNENWDNIDWEKLEKIEHVLNTKFNDKTKELPHDFRRAILTIPVNEKESAWFRECYAYKYHSLKKVCTVTRGILYRSLDDIISIISAVEEKRAQYTIFIKKLILELIANDNKDNSYEHIIKNFQQKMPQDTPYWKKHIIDMEEKDWKEGNYQPYIALEGEENAEPENYYLLKNSASPDNEDEFIEINHEEIKSLSTLRAEAESAKACQIICSYK